MVDAAVTDSSATFQMHECRTAVLSVELAFEPQIRAIEESVERVPGFAFDLSKALVESVCRTILADLGTSADPKWDAPKLLRETTNRLRLLPADQAQIKEVREAIVKTMNGLLQSIQGLCELRNKFGMASHGRDVAAAGLEHPQARLAAQAADTIASFLYRTHRRSLAKSPGERVYYDDHMDFNQWLDDELDQVVIGGETLQPSRVLYHTAITAYKVALTDFLAAPPGSERNEKS